MSRTSPAEAIALEQFHGPSNSSSGSLSIRAVDGSVQVSEAAAASYIPTRGRRVAGGDKQIPEPHGRNPALPSGPNLQATGDSDTRVDGNVPKKGHEWLAHLQYATLCWTVFLVGWNDGTTGPLLPRIQSNYNVYNFNI